MNKNLIFVSCGQNTEAEKAVGVTLKAVIDGTPGFEAYFAETVQDLEALGRHVLDGLRRCAGAVIILQDRGIVLQTDGSHWGHRSSVWVNQEVAILAYRQFLEGRKIPILPFMDPKVKLEGAMTSLIINPRPLGQIQDIAMAVKMWLSEGQFGGGSDAAFDSKWNQLSEPARKVVAALLEEGGNSVKETAVRRTAMRLFQMSSEAANQALSDARLQFIATDIVKLIHNIYSGDELTVHPTWEYHLRRKTAQWLAEQKAT